MNLNVEQSLIVARALRHEMHKCKSEGDDRSVRIISGILDGVNNEMSEHFNQVQQPDPEKVGEVYEGE